MKKEQLINLFDFLKSKRNRSCPIKVLDLSYENLIDIPEYLLSCINLEELHLNNNQIKKLENLDNLINLRQLDISNNYITKLENLVNLKELTKLFCKNNQIKKLEGLNQLNRLQQITISGNEIVKVDKELFEKANPKIKVYA